MSEVVNNRDEEPSYPIVPANRAHDPSYYVPPYDRDTELEPNFFCRARNTKREKYCRARAGQGTDHLGQGRCKNHGGSTPIKHGRYSDVIGSSVGEHLDRLALETEKEQLDVIPEAQLLRALTLDAGERWTEFFDAIIAWNEEESAEAAIEKRRPRFLGVPDMKDLGDLAKKTAEIINMVHKQRATNAIGMADFFRLMVAMSDEVLGLTTKHFGKRVPQEIIDGFTEDIQKKWQGIRLKV